MMLKPPNINGATVQEQLNQIKEYLFQTVTQLNFIISTLEKGEK